MIMMKSASVCGVRNLSQPPLHPLENPDIFWYTLAARAEQRNIDDQHSHMFKLLAGAAFLALVHAQTPCPDFMGPYISDLVRFEVFCAIDNKVKLRGYMYYNESGSGEIVEPSGVRIPVSTIEPSPK